MTRVRNQKKAFLALLACLFATGEMNKPAAFAQPAATPTKLRAAVKPGDSVPDELLIMPSPGADKDEINDALEGVHGTIVRTIGEGAQTCYVVRTEQGKLADTEKQLSNDPHFAAVQRNYVSKPTALSSSPGVRTNDPYFSNQWNLAALNAPAAWQMAAGSTIDGSRRSTDGTGIVIGIADTGSSTGHPELSGRAYSGYNAITRSLGQSPTGDHGTMVATTAVATTNNRLNTAAIAPGATVFPLKICTNTGAITEDAIIEAIYYAGIRGIRILNLSANVPVRGKTLSNPRLHAAFHNMARWYHNDRNGLFFLSAGNEGFFDDAPVSPNIMVVSSVSNALRLSRFSNYGNPVWFTAPGEAIYCSNSAGRTVSVSGTSFSSPSVAAVAALVLSVNPRLKNTDVESILSRTCTNPVDNKPMPIVVRTPGYGYGMPNAARAVSLAGGRSASARN